MLLFNYMQPETNQSEGHFAPLKKVTPLSKYLAMVIFIAMPFIGGWIGYQYAQQNIVVTEKSINTSIDIALTTDPVSESTEVVLQEGDDSKIKFLNPKVDGTFMVYDVMDGIIEGEWQANYGPSAYGGNSFEFIPDINIGPVSEFGFLLFAEDNPIDELFNYNLTELENSLDESTQVCSLKGGRATIKISKYGELITEKSGRDYAVLEDVIKFSPATDTNCL